MFLAGATGFVMKSSSQEVVISTVKSVMKFKLIYEDNVPYFFTFNPAHKPKIKLTPTEKKVLRYYSGGITLEAIAEKMNVSYDAIVFHSKNIRRKFNVKRLSDVIDLCEKKGITIY